MQITDISQTQFDRWLNSYLRPRCPEFETPLLAAINAYKSIRHSKSISQETLNPIISAASSTYAILWQNVVGLLADLTVDFSEARSRVDEMASSQHWQIRRNATRSIGKRTPNDFAVGILRKLLCDRSAKVRALAADSAYGLKLRELVSDFERAIQTETNGNTKRLFEFSLGLLRDGYLVDVASDGGFNVTVSCENSTCGRWISDSEFKSKGIDTIVTEIRNR